MVKFICFFVFLGVVSSCNFNNRQYNRILKDLDAKLEKQPEMVLDSLYQIDAGQLNKDQQAYFYLLKASATDKNLIYLENDSALNIAYEYYKNRKDYYNLARTQYYLGKYEQKRKKIKEAYKLYKQAEADLSMSEKKDLHLLGLIYYQLGVIQKEQCNYTDAETFCQKSYKNFIDISDTIAAAHALRLKGTIQIIYKNYTEAKKNILHSLRLIEKVNDKTYKVIDAQNSTLLTLSLFYRRTKNTDESIKCIKKCIITSKKGSKDLLSKYYYNLLPVYSSTNQLDSVEYYCNQMIIAAKNENNIVNQINGYKILSKVKEKKGNYKEACLLKDHSNVLKDSLNKIVGQNNLQELERKYAKADNLRQIYQAENNKLRAYAIITVILFGILIIGLPFYFRHRKLKTERDRLSQAIKHTEWGFLVTKEFITENHIAYDELERILNREKSMHTINSEVYNKFHKALILQKANYSGRLFNRLTNFDGNFVIKFQQLFPDFTTDELLMAMMIHHQWKLSDMTTIFHISVDALRKRKSRLAHKISSKLKEDIDLDDYLSKL